MKKLHGLVISWYYPPGNSSEGLVTYKLLKNSNLTYDVVTRKSHDMNMWDRKTDESKLQSDNVRVFKVPAKDEKAWVEEAVKFFDEHAGEYDFIMSRIMPGESHVAAAKIKERHPELFWIASFGDPLVDSPYIEVIKKEDNPFFLKRYFFREQPGLKKFAHLAISPTRVARKRVWEKERLDAMVWSTDCKRVNDLTFENADCLVFNNDYQYERAFKGEYKKYKSKGVVVPHGFDRELYPKSLSNEDDGRVHFIYVGHLDAMRNAKALLKALGKMKKKDERLADKMVVDFYGHVDDSDKVALVDNQVGDLVRLHKDIDYLTSLKKIAEADWAILIDTNLNAELEEYIYFPAKLVDYLGAKKKILAITQLRGASADVMNEVGAGQIVTHSADEIMMYLSKIVYQGYDPSSYKTEAWEKYDAKKIAADFDRMVEEHVKKDGRE